MCSSIGIIDLINKKARVDKPQSFKRLEGGSKSSLLRGWMASLPIGLVLVRSFVRLVCQFLNIPRIWTARGVLVLVENPTALLDTTRDIASRVILIRIKLTSASSVGKHSTRLLCSVLAFRRENAHNY